MERSAIILLSDLAAENIGGKPLIERIVDSVQAVVDEVILVANSENQKELVSNLLEPDVKILVHNGASEGDLAASLEGFESAQGTHSLLLSSTFALVSADVAGLFFELCPGKTAVIPRWPNQQMEPLQAVYHTKSAVAAAKMALGEGSTEVEALVNCLGGVRYFSTLALQEFDPELKTLFKVRTIVELKMAEAQSKPRRTKGAGKR